MGEQVTIKYKLIENIILGTDEKGIDKIFYLNEKIPDNKDNSPITIYLDYKDFEILLNMNEVIFNINEKIKRIEKGNIWIWIKKTTRK